MDIRRIGRPRASIIASFLILTAPAAVPASTLAVFSFDGPGTSFDAGPELLAPGLASAVWRDDAGRLSDLAGNPGRALSVSGFTGTNTLHLVLTQSAAQSFALERLSFDIRASASGPSSWSISHAGNMLASGAVGTTFRSFDVPLGLLSSAPELVLDLRGLGASAITGTLRLDNVRLEGELRPVPLPGSIFLFATPLLGAALARLRKRCAQLLTGSGHSRQPSSRGKYSPSMMGRVSRPAMMRP
jgi:hypothetical protein